MARRGSVALVAAAVLLSAVAPADAAQRPFSKRFGETLRGDIEIAGNILHDCDPNDGIATGGTCAGARAGTDPGYYNNDHPLVQVDADGGAADTFNSSRANLDLPDGAEVVFAGLYWSATLTSSTGAASPDPSAAATVRLDTPAPGGYVPVVAPGPLDDLGVATSLNEYAAFADVTGAVAAAGEGDYWVGDVQSAPGLNTYAGWSLVVAYRDPGQPLRNLTVFDGYMNLCDCASQGSVPSFSSTIEGFRTPQAGPVASRIGIVGHEGEITTGSGDPEGVSIDGTAINGALNPADDIFNGSITRDGVNQTNRTPDWLHQVSGLDIDLIPTSGVLSPNTTDATLDLVANSGDGWYPQALTFATEVEQPLIDATKTVTDVNGAPARAGDELEYTISVRNDGNDDADNTVVEDVLAASLEHVSGGQLQGSTVSSSLGAIAPNETKVFTFRARIADSTAAGTDVVNVGTVDYEIPASTVELHAETNPVTTTVAEPAPPDPTPTAEPTVVPSPSPSPSPAPAGGVTDVVLGCSDRKVVLEDVVPSGSRVQLIGVADRAFAGRTVEIVFRATGNVVATAVVQANGTFATTAPLPAKKLRRSNKARYQARIGTETSLDLKLLRRMRITSISAAGGQVTITGRVEPPLAPKKKDRRVLLQRVVNCSGQETVKTFQPKSNGSFTVSTPVPAGQAAAVYRLRTKVKRNKKSKRIVNTFTLPRAIGFS